MDQYLRCTRSAWYSYVFALPLLAVYQAVALLANIGSSGRVINGADALIQNALSIVGVHGWLGTSIVLAIVAGIVVYRADAKNRSGPIRWGYFATMLGESALYA